MNKYIIIMIMSLIASFSLAGCSPVEKYEYKTQERYTEDNNKLEGDLPSEQELHLSNFSNRAFPTCTKEQQVTYWESNDYFTLNNVSFRYNKIKLLLSVGPIDTVIEELKIKFRVNDEFVKVSLSYITPCTTYQVLIPAIDAKEFQLVSMTWDLSDSSKLSFSDYKGFNYKIKLIGKNTLRYVTTDKIIQLIDDSDTIIDTIKISGFGKRVVNWNAKYYREVNLE